MQFTTLIPIYKTQFLEDLVACLNAQTLQDFQVIFSDDSPSQDVAQLLDDLHLDTPIRFSYRVIPGPRLGPASNAHHLFTAWNFSSSYVHYLLDDDLIFPDFYASHTAAYQQTTAQACFSARIIVNERKTPLAGISMPPDEALPNKQSIEMLDFATCVRTIVPTCNNWLGELSNATFLGTALAGGVSGQLQRLPYYGLNDLGIFLEVLTQTPAAYIHNTLGAFRINRLQTSGNAHSNIFKSTVVSWISLALDAHTMGLLHLAETQQCLRTVRPSIVQLAQSHTELMPLMQILDTWQRTPEDITSLHKAFTHYWLTQLQNYPDYLAARSPIIPKTGALAPPALS